MRDVWERFIWALAHSVGIDLFRRTRAWLTNGTCEEVEYGTASFFLIVEKRLMHLFIKNPATIMLSSFGG
jgi:hypothetical protein